MRRNNNIGDDCITNKENDNKRYAYGFDLSLSCSGIAIIDIDSLEPRLITSIETDPKQNHGERLYEQYNFIGKVVNVFKPEKIYIEKGFSRHAVATQAIFKMVGCVNMLLKEYEPVYLAPTTVKKNITGNGRAKKDELREALESKFPNTTFKNEDESDALGVAITGLINDGLIEWDIPKL